MNKIILFFGSIITLVIAFFIGKAGSKKEAQLEEQEKQRKVYDDTINKISQDNIAHANDELDDIRKRMCKEYKLDD